MSERAKWPLWAKIALGAFIILVLLPVLIFFITKWIEPSAAKAQTTKQARCLKICPEPLPGVEPPTCEPDTTPTVTYLGNGVWEYWDGCGGRGLYVYPLNCPAGTAPNPDGSNSCATINSVRDGGGDWYYRPAPDGGWERFRCDNYDWRLGPVTIYDYSICQKWSWRNGVITAHDKLEIYCDPTVAGDIANWNCGQVTARGAAWRDNHRGWTEWAIKEYEHCLVILALTVHCDTYRLKGRMVVWAGGGYDSAFNPRV
jgi:hypothetical protein